MWVAAISSGVSLWKKFLPYCVFPTWEVELFAPSGVGVGELVAGIHVAAVIVLKNDQLMSAQGGAECRSHTDIHAAVTAHHHKGNLAVRVFPAFLALVKRLHNAA